VDETDGNRLRPAKRTRSTPAPLTFPSIAGVTFDKTLRRWGGSPVIELPPEVWALVFARMRHDASALLNAGHVSREWRSLALGELRRWTLGQHHSGSELEPQLAFLRQYCPRVETLDVRFDSLDLSHLDHILSAVPRVRALRLVISPGTLARLRSSGDSHAKDGSDEESDQEQEGRAGGAIPESIRSLDLTFGQLRLSAASRLDQLWERLPARLDVLKLIGLRYSPDSLVALLAARSHGITKLHLKNCFSVNDAVLSSLPTAITSLSLQGSSKVTDAGVISIATRLPHVRAPTFTILFIIRFY
jgi:hypothetical protein